MSDSGASFGGRVRTGAGGTSGGVIHFFVGLVLVGIGAYLLLDRVTVHTSFWRMSGGGSAFGVTLIPMLIGVALLFFSGKSILGWVLTIAGFGAIIVGVIANMDIYFQPTSLTATLIMLGMMAAGLGLIIKSLRPQPK
ncbi:MAG: hypothetical protein H7X95_03860 [Deltaproteobacteria bacterium]|nr:hypothetical protein [Deltaproteobacteria bacterium]